MSSTPPRPRALALGIAALIAWSTAAAGDVPREMWVELSAAPPAAAASGPPARRQREQVARQQAEVIAHLREIGIEPAGRLRIQRNAILVRVNPERVAEIERIPGVVRVRPGEPLRPRGTQARGGSVQGNSR